MIYVNYKQKYEKSYRKIWRFQEKAVPLHSQLSNTPIATLKQGAIAQLVEQRTENPCVAGSTPAGTTICQRLPLGKPKGFFCIQKKGVFTPYRAGHIQYKLSAIRTLFPFNNSFF